MAVRNLIQYVLVFICASMMAQESDLLINFDALFPPSPYKGVMTACMRVRNAVELLHEQQHRENVELMCDVLAGRLLRLDVQLVNLYHDGPALHPEDKEYMISMIDCMVSEIEQVAYGKKIYCSQLSHTFALSIKDKLATLKVAE